MTLQLEQLNKASPTEALQLLDGLYEHSPWIAEGALKMRPFASWAHLKHCMAQVLSDAGREAQIGLIRAHPELAGKAMVRKELTAESTNEQTKAGLTECTAEEFEKIHALNAAYKQKFGWPFILAVRGPRGVGLNKHAKYLLTGSHYDTVRNGGKYDGRLGIYVPIACVKKLAATKTRLKFGIEVVAFAEEEGQRYKATFLGSGALVGQFNKAWLDQVDADGVSMREAMKQAGLNENDIPKIQRKPSDYLGFVEVHIEQGPVLNEMNLPLGVVSSINGSVRYLCEMMGTASHAGTTPMDRRRDAATAVAELALFMEKRAAQDGDSVATIGQLQVPNGSINVIPGKCLFSMDMRAPTDPQRDALERDVLQALDEICERRGLVCQREATLRAPAAPSAPEWQKRWEHALKDLGVPLFVMPSGAGHDAMKLHEVMPQAMLFVRGENSGISHNPLESTTSDDMQLCIDAFAHVLHHLA
ncbi:MAG: 2-oxo-4-hydroxy-4-carboxy-5-ureidoimidazoline decarboxylase [Betaproteobacteria bacterium]|nr:2-oxo-4-hydroxy-4-carboxy-5-ureidoimidazoline decarboxylase [Betaproteobacteria bacterium]